MTRSTKRLAFGVIFLVCFLAVVVWQNQRPVRKPQPDAPIVELEDAPSIAVKPEAAIAMPQTAPETSPAIPTVSNVKHVAPDDGTSSAPSDSPTVAPTLEAAREAMKRRAYDKAAVLLKEALEAEIDPEKKQQIRAMLAESLAATQDLDGAVAIYREYLIAATSDLERVLGVTRLAAVLSLQKRFEEAEAVLAAPGLIGDDPAQRQAIQHAQLRLWQSQPGRLAEVATELEQKIAAEPADRDSLDLLGTIYLKVQRDYDKAKPVYEKILAQNPVDPQTQNTLIGIYQETRDYAKARDIYERYLEHHPEQADGIRYQIAALYVQSGQGDDAVAYAEKHLAGTEASVDQREMAARIYEFSGRLDDAARLLQEAQSATTDAAKKTDLQFRQVDLLTRQEKYAEVETIVRRILAENTADRDIRARANQELIRLYQMQGRVGELDL